MKRHRLIIVFYSIVLCLLSLFKVSTPIELNVCDSPKAIVDVAQHDANVSSDDTNPITNSVIQSCNISYKVFQKRISIDSISRSVSRKVTTILGDFTQESLVTLVFWGPKITFPFHYFW